MKKALFILLAALVLCGATASAQAKKKAPRKAAAKEAFCPSQFTGTYENSYSDNLGGMVTDYLTLQFDEESGEVCGVYKNESGDITRLAGIFHGDHLFTRDVDIDEEFAEIFFYDINTLKVVGFTGTFKRTSNEFTELEAVEREVEVIKPETIEDAADKIRKATAGATPFPND